MAITRSTPIQQADMQALADLANSVLLPLVNANVSGDGTGALDTGWAFSGGVVEAWGGANFYHVPASTADGMQFSKSPQPAYDFSGSSANWLKELNRIRGDYWNLIFTAGLGADEILLSPDNIVSGPWVVGVNDPVTFPMTQWHFNNYYFSQPVYQENLVGSLPAGVVDACIIFRAVRFYYASDDAADGVTISTGRIVQLQYPDAATDFSLNYVAARAGSWNVKIAWQFQWTGGGDPPALPAISGFAFTVTGGAAIDWQTTERDAFNNSANSDITPFLPVGNNFYILRGEFTMDVPVGSGTVEITATTVPTGFAMLTPNVSSFIEYSAFSDSTESNGIHPTSAVRCIAGADQPADSNFQLNSVYADASWRVDPSVKGVWVANTLPVPGQNVFLDQDLPPYVGTYMSNFNGAGQLIAVSATLGWGGEHLDNPPADGGQPEEFKTRFDSSMRQQALLRNGDYMVTIGGITFDTGDPKYNLISESCQPQAAQWLVRRDTDFVPFDFGLNVASTGFYGPALAVADPTNTRLSVNYYHSYSLDATVRAVKIHLVAAGSTTVGWKDGQFQYGDDLATKLKIYVQPNGSFPLTSYDFATTNNEVTIDGTRNSDGGMHYLAALIADGALNIAVQNLSSADVEYDLILEVEYAPNLHRQYCPAHMECFSYVIDGSLPLPSYYPGAIVKPVPQSGYCIFKVRATRMPVQNSAGISITPASGAEINVMLGQNRLAADNTLSFAPFMDDIISPGAGDTGTGAGDTDMGAGGSGQPAMITIPANARDTGDMDVFIPVLAGNELVWQCDDDVIVEAWANWQPIFFSSQYGTTSPYSAFVATAFQYCLEFANRFDLRISNYPVFSEASRAKVQFPPSIEIYKDLEACLSLI